MLMRLLLNLPLIFLSTTLVSYSSGLEIPEFINVTQTIQSHSSSSNVETFALEAEGFEEYSIKKFQWASLTDFIPQLMPLKVDEFPFVSRSYFNLEKTPPTGRGPPSPSLS